MEIPLFFFGKKYHNLEFNLATANAEQKEKFEFYQMVLKSENQLQQDYFAKPPDIKEAYYEWLEDQQ
ncbi:MAG: hypothetical protein WBV11_01050 [Salegentibacter sp.]